MVARVIPVEDFDLVIFGGTGDLARRKILPSLFHRFVAGQMPPDARIIGAARGDLGDAAYRKMAREALGEFVDAADRDPDQIKAFLGRLHFVTIDATGEKGWADLAGLMRPDVVRAFCLSARWPSGCTSTRLPPPSRGSWSKSRSDAIWKPPAR
jgi:glucose-6-phosphate 1-dehydrogenase